MNDSNSCIAGNTDNMAPIRRLTAMATQLAMPRVSLYNHTSQKRFGKYFFLFL